jgi:hypothetical protein
MLTIKKQYLVDEQQRPVAVVLDLETFAKIEELLEDYGLTKAIHEAQYDTMVPLEEARKRFSRMRRRQ